jgi:hypothetical protein
MRRTGAILLVLLGLALPASAAAAAPPAIEYLAPSPLRNHEATLRFTVDPEGLATSYEVEYGLKAGEYFPYSYVWDRELPAGNEPVAGEAKVPAYFQGQLAAGTEYHWRVVAENAAGTTEGPDQVFTTTNGVPPMTAALPATEQMPTSAVMHGTVDPEGTPLTRCWFQVVSEGTIQNKGWTLFDTYENGLIGDLVPCEETPAEIGSGSAPVPVHATIAGLDQKPYEFRLEAANEYEDRRYSNSELIGPVWVKTLGADAAGANEATVHGWIYKHYSGSASWWVEYGVGGLSQQTPASLLADSGREYDIGKTLTCLQPNSEYTYRLAGSNAAGTVYGPERAFVTGPGGSSACLPANAVASPAAEAVPAPLRRKHRQVKRRHRRPHQNTSLVASRPRHARR